MKESETTPEINGLIYNSVIVIYPITPLHGLPMTLDKRVESITSNHYCPYFRKYVLL